MRYIEGLDNHENLEELLEKAETRIKENSLDEAMTHMRKAVEYMVQQFVRENPDCSGNDLSEMMHNLEGAGILKKGDANILHQIRRKGNTVGAHVTGEKITRQQAEELFDDLLRYVPKFLDAIPYPSSRELKGKGRLSIDFDKIPPLEMKTSLELIEEIEKEREEAYYTMLPCEEDCQWTYGEEELTLFQANGDAYYLIPVPKEYIYHQRDGKTFINRSEYARYYDRKVRKIVNAKKQLDDWEGNVLIPGMLQEFFGFSRVYQDGITPVFEEPNGNHIASEQALYAHEIRLPNSVTHVTCPNLRWFVDGSHGNTITSEEVCTNVEQIYLSNQLTEDCHFNWTRKVPANKVFLNPGENSKISLRNGSVYSADGRTLIYARVEKDSFQIPEGVEIIGKDAFEAGVEQIVFPKSLRKLNENALRGYRGDKLILPDSVTDIDERAYHESLQLFYESKPDVNINPRYAQYLKKKKEQEEQSRIQQAEFERRWKIQQAQKEKEEQERKKKEEIARKEAEAKAEAERKQKERAKAGSRMAKLAALVLAAVGVFWIGTKIWEQIKVQQAEEAYKKAEAVTIGTSEDGLYEYQIYHDTLTITKYLGSEENLVIPGEIDGYPVRILGPGMCNNVPNQVRSIVIPDSVEELQSSGMDGTFAYLDSLEEVYIPGNIKVIGDYAFHSCDHLTGVEMEEGIEKIGKEAFSNCSSLPEIILPASVKEIEERAFSMCDSLTGVEMKEGIEKIGTQAFVYCGQLEELTIPQSVKEMGDLCLTGTRVRAITVSPDCQLGDIFGADRDLAVISYY